MFNIKNFIAAVKKSYKDDFDGKYRYRDPDSFPAIQEMLGLYQWKPDRRQKAYGRIRGGFFYYVTGPMIIIVVMLTYTVVNGFTRLLPYFETNVYLNGIIISLMIFGILKSFHNSYLLFRTAQFFRLLEDVIRKDEIVDEDIYKVRRALENEGKMVNTVAMVETVDNIQKFGHPNFNDHRARLIKSKLGFRVGKNKANVSYIAGILVMLGLLGTFLGLLATIDAVGGALNSMSSMGGDGGEVDTEQMTEFIGSLAKPLQGMGLAFSSSLFGLSGSLLIGFFLYLGGTPQNAFMENVSRWIDDRIPGFDPEKKGKIQPKAKEGDIKDWMAGFINMSVKTNRSIASLCKEISQSTNETRRVWAQTEEVHSTQKQLVSYAQGNHELLKNIDASNLLISETVPQIFDVSQQTLSNLHNLQKSSQSVLEVLPGITSAIDGVGNQVSATSSKLDSVAMGTASLSNHLLEIDQSAKQISENVVLSVQQGQRSITSMGEAQQRNLDMLALMKEDAQQRNAETLALIREVAEQSSATSSQAMSSNAEASQRICQAVEKTQENLQLINESLNAFFVYSQEEGGTQYLKDIETNIVDMNKAHQEVSLEMRALLKRLDSDPYVKRTETMIERLDQILNELNAKIKNFLSKKD